MGLLWELIQAESRQEPAKVEPAWVSGGRIAAACQADAEKDPRMLAAAAAAEDEARTKWTASEAVLQKYGPQFPVPNVKTLGFWTWESHSVSENWANTVVKVFARPNRFTLQYVTGGFVDDDFGRHPKTDVRKGELTWVVTYDDLVFVFVRRVSSKEKDPWGKERLVYEYIRDVRLASETPHPQLPE